MKSLYHIIVLSLCLAYNAYAQPYFNNYDWPVEPNYEVNQFSNEHMVSLNEHHVTEFIFEDSNLVEYYLEHKAFFLNSDDSIEEFNKIYLPFSSDTELKITKARVINLKGEIINLSEDKILTATDNETNRVYKYFAFEGIEKGSIIEYLYVVKKDPEYSGKLIRLQSDFDKIKVSFKVYAPKNLIFKFKSFNGLNEVVNDTLTTGKNLWQLNSVAIPKIENEEYSAYNAEKMAIAYALDQNTASNKKEITSYAGISQNIYNFYNVALSKKTENALTKFIKDIKLVDNANTDDKIRTIETYIKTNIYNPEFSNNSLSNLDEVLANKVASSTGLLKLYCAIFNNLNIDYQIVFTSDRNILKFDNQFEANNFLQEVLLYFPDTDKYLAPTNTDSRYGFPPAYFTDNYGLFIKEVTVGDFKSAIGKINYINPIPAELTKDIMEIQVSFDNADLSQTDIHLQESLTGYYAMNLHPFMNLIPAENKANILKSYAQRLDENAEIISSSFENEDPNLFGIKPLIFKAHLKSANYIEKAGNKYLFNIGNLIGQQIEMYQEKERVLPVENEFQRVYERTIVINLPNNFEVANLDDLNIKYSYDVDGSNTLNFHSFYSLDNQILTVTANEHYKVNRVARQDFEKYRTVINSAADFNKIVLVLAPKQ